MKIEYAVLKKLTEVTVTDPLTGVCKSIKIANIDGFIPVFHSKKKAIESAENGTYTIIKLQSFKKPKK